MFTVPHMADYLRKHPSDYARLASKLLASPAELAAFAPLQRLTHLRVTPVPAAHSTQ